ncbi:MULTISPECIES: DUF6090 family protein [Aequorivita]|uniref:Uncharacterized protein n=1 Tax=Aequorivita iocasae TaxID=2803865 RepID=A0ABX7DQF8_9FLAO|nr:MULTISPECIES: DUF6090 family protein [Aequorivita]QQX76303.1 hypothetical protein JK629_13375 [Aequorivita iocasae]UCA55766.1 hypothetical protein LDL78_13440 [Aequorivita sp. F7]
MAKIFRRIRIDMLTNNRLGKYLLYAVGEIILVVIGILLALSINNANQEKATQAKELAYLNGLKNEFHANQQKLQNLIDVNKKNYESAKSILAFVDDTIKTNEKRLSQLLFDAFAFEIAFSPNNSLLNEMINSGSLKDISNNELRIHLASWESVMENIKFQEQDLRTQRENVRDLLRSEQGSIRTVFDQTKVSQQVLDIPPKEHRFSNNALVQTRTFENNLLTFILTSTSAETAHYIPLLQEIDKILNLLDTELKRE